jgi:hypothetical protein
VFILLGQLNQQCYESQICITRRTKNTYRILTAMAVHEDRRELPFRVPRSTRALLETCS